MQIKIDDTVKVNKTSITNHSSSVRPSIFRSILIIAITITAAVASNFSFAQSANPIIWAKGRILVQFRAGLPDATQDNILKSHGGKKSKTLRGINVHVVELPPNANELMVAQALSHHPHVKFAEVDAAVPLDQTTNDPYTTSEWHLNKIGAFTTWDNSTGSGVTIAILDTGVDPTHPDLMAKLLPGYNFFDNNTNTADVHGHGTKSAGTAAAITNNGIGVASVAGNANIMPIRVTDTSGLGYISYMANGIIWAADHGARVASLSFQNPSAYSTILSAASYMRSKGGVVICAAGNTGAYDSTTASDVITVVSAVDNTDIRASWSTYGPSIDISAPGVGIYTTTLGGSYGTWSGTSAATPITAGVMALVIAANPSLAPGQIDNILYSSAIDLGTAGYDQYYGYGRVNAAAAVNLAKNTPTIDSQAPTVNITSPGAITVNGIVQVNVNANDNVGINKVDLYVNDKLLATDAIAPYSFSWDTTQQTDGPASLVAKAYDTAGNVASSTIVKITVANTLDVTPPKVVINSPVNGSIVSGIVNINASASDNVGVAKLSVYVDNVLKCVNNASTVSCNWNSKKSTRGVHTVKAEAQDLSGNTAFVSVQVTN